MIALRRVERRTAPVRTPPRIGLFGLLGSGNLGNDGSLEAVLGFLRDRHPNAVIDLMCAGPEQVTSRYGLPATRLNWYRGEYHTVSGVAAAAMKALGKAVDAVRTFRWVRRHDVVIVPGMGVLEATLPLRPWGFPYALFLLCASGRLCGTKVALVSVGADVIRERATRWLVTRAAGFADYRSYRDALSMNAMRTMGVDTSHDAVYPDLVFALTAPAEAPAAPGTVGVGVMAYHGGNADRRRAVEINASYVDTMTRFVRWLVDSGRRVRLFTGDDADESVVREILAGGRAHRPGQDPPPVEAAPVSSLPDLMRQMSSVDTVVATRYHNVLCALRLGKPTLSLGYAAKNDVLMASMGLGEFCLSARSLDLGRLIEQFTALEARRERLRRTLAERNVATEHRAARQLAALSAALLTGPARAPVPTRGRARARARVRL